MRATPAGMLRAALALAALLLATALRAQPAAADLQVFPFGQALDMAAVPRAIAVSPAQLPAAIEQQGLRVLRVATPQPARAPNPHLAALPAAGAELLRSAEFQDSYEGRLVLDESCGRRTILIRDTASDYTLLHEFVHAQLRPLQDCEPDDCVEQRFGAAFRRLTLYQRRLFDDPYRLLEPLWRRDILAAQLDVARDLYQRIRLGQSQEAIVEKVLARLIDARSPYHDGARQAQGRRYGMLMIDNAVDVFNAVHASCSFVADAVRQLRAAIVEGDIEPRADHRLEDADVDAAERGAREVQALLQPVRAEIDRLKRFYEEP